MDAARKLPDPGIVTDESNHPALVQFSAADYIDLLIGKHITDPELWPREIRQGAAMLARIREIETECVSRVGSFDWEALEPAVQDEYDGLRIDLDEMIDRWLGIEDESISLEELAREHGIELP